MQSEQKTLYPRNRWFWFATPLVIGLSLDLWTKSAVFRLLEFPQGMQKGRILWGIDHFLGLQLSLNPGALFGFVGGKAPLFAMLSLVAAVGIVWWLFVYGAAKSRFLTCLLGMITAGILGNMYDRLGLHGICWVDGSPAHVVRDWILVMLGSYHWPNFNLADCYLVCGTFLLCLTNFVAPQILAPRHTHDDSKELPEDADHADDAEKPASADDSTDSENAKSSTNSGNYPEDSAEHGAERPSVLKVSISPIGSVSTMLDHTL
ncbi:MAG: signal peptidase II [Thermoguttaceae bacterium]|nr:signal peptidase II [Thermoguttaceae bacterium]